MLPLLAKYSNWKFILPLFLLFAGTTYAFKVYGDQINEIAGTKIEILDLKSEYDHEEVLGDFTKMKEEGREINKFMTGKLDMIYPFAYGLFFILVLAFLTRKIFGAESKLVYLSLFPVLLMILDYFENFNTLKLLNSFPDFTPEQVAYGSQLTGIKQLMTNISFGLIVLFLVIWGGKVIKEKMSAS